MRTKTVVFKDLKLWLVIQSKVNSSVRKGEEYTAPKSKIIGKCVDQSTPGWNYTGMFFVKMVGNFLGERDKMN